MGGWGGRGGEGGGGGEGIGSRELLPPLSPFFKALTYKGLIILPPLRVTPLLLFHLPLRVTPLLLLLLLLLRVSPLLPPSAFDTAPGRGGVSWG